MVPVEYERLTAASSTTEITPEKKAKGIRLHILADKTGNLPDLELDGTPISIFDAEEEHLREEAIHLNNDESVAETEKVDLAEALEEKVEEGSDPLEIAAEMLMLRLEREDEMSKETETPLVPEELKDALQSKFIADKGKRNHLQPPLSLNDHHC